MRLYGASRVAIGRDEVRCLASRATVDYPSTPWPTLPLKKIMATLHIKTRHFDRYQGAAIGSIPLGAAAVLSAIRPYTPP
jgi:hypothetical protein